MGKFAERLKSLRAEKNLTQKQLAADPPSLIMKKIPENRIMT